MKRVLSFLLAVLLVVNTAGIQNIYAEEAQSTEAKISVSQVETSRSSVDLDVAISDNPGICSLNVLIKYDKNVFSPDSEGIPLCIAKGAFDDAGSLEYQENANGCAVLWYNSANVNSNGTVFTLHLNIADGTAAGTYPIQVSVVSNNTIRNSVHIVDDVEEEYEELVPVTVQNGSVTVREVTSRLYLENQTTKCNKGLDIPVLIDDNPGVAGILFTVKYDKSKYVPVMDGDEPKITRGSAFGSGQMMSAITEDGWRVLWSNTSDVNADGIVCTLHFNPVEGLGSGTSDFTLALSEDDTLNANEEIVSFTAAGGKASLSHGAMLNVPEKEASCIEEGNIEYWICQDCGKYFSDQDGKKCVSEEDVVIAAKGHEGIIIPAEEADCLNDGLTEGTKCSVCKKIIVEQYVVPAFGHKFVDGSCIRCGREDGSVAELTAKLTQELSYMTVGSETDLIVKAGESLLDASRFNYSTSNAAVIKVNENGRLTAVAKGGAIITASLKNDPLNRCVSINIKVQDLQENAYVTLNGENVSDGGLVVGKTTTKRTYMLGVSGTAQSYSFSTSDASVASINKSVMTIPANAYGACTITAVSKDKKTEITFPVVVRNFAPRLTVSSVTLNNNVISGVEVPYRTSYGKQIVAVEFHEIVNKVVSETATEKVTLEVTKNAIVVKNATDAFKNGKTISGKLWITFGDDSVDKSLSLSIKRSDSYPAVTVKAESKINNFYTNASTTVNFTPAKATISNIEIQPGAEYKGEYVAGKLTVTNLDVPVSKKTLTGYAKVYFEGYKGYRSVKVTVGTINQAPAIKLSATSGYIYAEAPDKGIKINVIGGNIELEDDAVTTTNSTIELAQDGNQLTFTKNWVANESIPLSVQNSNWSKPVKLTYTVKMATGKNRLPSLKLATSTLKLNRLYPAFTAETTTSLTHLNVSVNDAILTATGTTRTDALSVKLVDGVISAKIVEGKTPAAGTYKYSFIPQLNDGRTLNAVTIKVVVSGSKVTASLKASGKIDLLYRDSAKIVYKVTPSNVKATLESVAVAGANAELFDVALGEAENTFELSLKSGAQCSIKKYYVPFILKFNDIEDTITTSSQTVKITQGTIKAAATPVSQTVYMSSDRGYKVSYTVNLTSPAGAEIKSARLGSMKSTFTKSLTNAGGTINWRVSDDGKSLTVDLDLKDITKMVAGTTYEIPIIITPKNAVNSSADLLVKMKVTIKK